MRDFYGPGRTFFMQGDFWWLGVVSMIIHILLLIAIIYFAVKLFNKFFNKVDESKAKENTAMAILRERYAKGEIDSEEFKNRKADLE